MQSRLQNPETRSAVTLRNVSEESPRLCSFADDFAQQTRLSAVDRGKLLVILDELFSNVVRHGYDASRPLGTVEVVLSLADKKLCIEMFDDGRPFDPLAAASPRLDLPPTQRPVGGLGIYIVRSLVHEAYYTRIDGRNCLTLLRTVERAKTTE